MSKIISDSSICNIAVTNIKNTLEILNVDLYSYVVDWVDFIYVIDFAYVSSVRHAQFFDSYSYSIDHFFDSYYYFC